MLIRRARARPDYREEADGFVASTRGAHAVRVFTVLPKPEAGTPTRFGQPLGVAHRWQT